jgi:hypothetical protein
VAPVEIAGAHWDLRDIAPVDDEGRGEAWRQAAHAADREQAAIAAATAIHAEVREQLHVDGRPRTTAAGALAAARAISLLAE